MNSIEKIEKVFENAPAFMPYYTIGFPNSEESIDILEACAKNGADLMELGIPFSDPLADGPTIQNSTQIALQNGTTVKTCLKTVKELRNRNVSIPLLLMGYINPIIAYGEEKFILDAKQAGANGFIIPDLPPNEAQYFIEICEKEKMAIIFLISPNSTEDRIKFIIEKSSGFIYLVSVMGITGERNNIADNLQAFYKKIKSLTNKPIAIGFGVSTPEQAKNIGAFADGVIVGSALIKSVTNASDKTKEASNFVASYKNALNTLTGEKAK
jgi:tryptophan synthase alpha chain